MNRKQWLILGIGLVAMGVLFNYAATINDCLALQKEYLTILEKARNPSDDTLFGSILINQTLTINSCLDKNIDAGMIGGTFFGLGILFIICGFLEPRNKH